jgi:hypothetical protein
MGVKTQPVIAVQNLIAWALPNRPGVGVMSKAERPKGPCALHWRVFTPRLPV